MRYWNIDTDALGWVPLHIAPTLMKRADNLETGEVGESITDRDGRLQFMGEVNLPGTATGLRDRTLPRAVRVKFLDEAPAGLADGAVVRLTGRTTLTVWYVAGREATSEATISPEGIEVAPAGTRPSPEVLRGLIPLLNPSRDKNDPTRPPRPFTLLDVYSPEDRDAMVAVLGTPSDVVSVEGIVEVDLAEPTGWEDLVMAPVDPIDLRGRLILPDPRDVGRNLKSALHLSARRLELRQDTPPPIPTGGRRQAPASDTPAPAEG